MKKLISAFLIVGASSLAGCSVTGPSDSELLDQGMSEINLCKDPHGHPCANVFSIVSVDGDSAGMLWRRDRVFVKPGQHQVWVRWDGQTSFSQDRGFLVDTLPRAVTTITYTTKQVNTTKVPVLQGALMLEPGATDSAVPYIIKRDWKGLIQNSTSGQFIDIAEKIIADPVKRMKLYKAHVWPDANFVTQKEYDEAMVRMAAQYRNTQLGSAHIMPEQYLTIGLVKFVMDKSQGLTTFNQAYNFFAEKTADIDALVGSK